MGILIRLFVFFAIVLFASYCVLNDPINYFGKAFGQLRCSIDESRPCPPDEPPSTVATISVFFVDASLATREGRRVAILGEDWPYCYDPTGDVYRVPAYFETDFASIPSYAQFYVRPTDPDVIGAAVIHDWLYALGGMPRNESKRIADEIFRFELKRAGVNVVKRNIMYGAVRFLGGRSFGEMTELRFRDPATGELFMRNMPAEAVIDNLGAGCPGFLDRYWPPGAQPKDPSHTLDPRFIQQWIELRR